MADKFQVCKRIDCAYFSKSTRSCDYRLHRGCGRGMPVSECTHYTTDKDALKAKRRTAIFVSEESALRYRSEQNMRTTTGTEQLQAQSGTPASKVSGKPEKRVNWERVMVRLGSGESMESLANEYGITMKQFKNGLYAELGRDKKVEEKSKPAHMPDATPPESVAVLKKEMPEMVFGEIDKTQTRCQLINNTFRKVSQTVAIFCDNDSVRVKESVLVMVREILEQTDEELKHQTDMQVTGKLQVNCRQVTGGTGA